MNCPGSRDDISASTLPPASASLQVIGWLVHVDPPRSLSHRKSQKPQQIVHSHPPHCSSQSTEGLELESLTRRFQEIEFTYLVRQNVGGKAA
ncbi:hypothetical protein VTN96DRAFT_2825 [Rasamsonia emersonii]